MDTVQTGNHFFDKKILRLGVQPDGDIDATPQWTSDVPEVNLAPATNGLSCDVTADANVGAFVVTVSAPADNPNTPGETETVGLQFAGSFSHSKATTLLGTFSEIDKA